MPTGPRPELRLRRWHRAVLLVGATVLLSLANRPFGQAYLAWVGLVPLLLALRGLSGPITAAGWGFLAGVLYFGANIWWLWTASIPGLVALIGYLSLYWALAAAVLHASRALTSQARAITVAFAIPFIWTAAEYLRATLIDAHGFPWLLLGHSQPSLPILCQVADLAGVSGVSFWVATLNALAFLAVTRGVNRRLMVPSLAAGGVMLAVIGYGGYRIGQPLAGPEVQVLLLQPDQPHLPGGARTVSREEAVEWYLRETPKALAARPADLVVWPEAAMPPLNDAARTSLASAPAGAFLERTHLRIADLCRRTGTSLITGGSSVEGWVTRDRVRIGTEILNSSYLYLPDGSQSLARYDKNALVLFSERVPFRSIGWLHEVMLWLSPPVANQPLHAGASGRPVLYKVPIARTASQAAAPTLRVATPICLENIFPDYVCGLVLDREGHRRVDLLVNLSNDGWFAPIERHQHLANVIFRSIETRTPQARASNTGISALIDSCGRVLAALPPGSQGSLHGRLPLDERVAPYARYGDVFAIGCVIVATGTWAATKLRRRPKRIGR